MDFEQTRRENDELFLPQIDAIKNAKNIKVLIPFAKAYLGMFYVIDGNLAEKDKVKLLASNMLAEAIFEGFVSSLKLENLPTIEKIGQAKAEKNEFSEGYVILAGLDLIAQRSLKDIAKLDEYLLEMAIGFHFSNNTDHIDIWYDYLLTHHKSSIAPAISKFWMAMLNNNASYLPGKNLVFGTNPDIEIIRLCVLPLLTTWTHAKPKVLSQLLCLAFKYSNADDFLIVCELALSHDENLNEKTRLYWLAAAFLIAPEKYISILSNYVGRVKLKIMPLLDFVILILGDKSSINITFNAKLLMQLLRMIAPVFPPQHHVYGALGELDINSKNVMLLFYNLACSNDKNIENEIKYIRKARVMKIYSDVIDDVLELQKNNANKEGFIFPSFEAYLEKLFRENYLQGRSNKFDLR